MSVRPWVSDSASDSAPMLARAARWLWLQLMLIGLGLGSLLWNLVAWLLRPLMRGRSAVMLGRWMISRGYRLFWWVAEHTGMMKLERSALACLSREERLVIVANHPALLDAMLLVSELPRAGCIMKAGLMGNPLLGAGAQLAGYLPNDGAFGLIKRAVADLEAGGQLLLFPEGTRTVEGRLGPLQPGFALIAQRAQADVQVVFIDTDSPYLGKGWPLWKLPPLPIRFSVRLGPRLPARLGADGLLQAVREVFEKDGPFAEKDALDPGAGRGMQAPASTVDHRAAVLIPTYNAGDLVLRTTRQALAAHERVLVVVDGSTDGSTQGLLELQASEPGLQVLVLPVNQGKGAAVLAGLLHLRAQGCTHALTMDSDGQHPASLIGTFMQASAQAPQAMILGRPVFDASAPLLRVRGRRVSNWWTGLETLWAGIGDSLYGFRVYPVDPLIRVMQAQRWMRRFDFDTEAVVRLAWAGVRPVNVDAPVTYLRAEDGGVSHFRYLRDNVLLTWMHTRLMLGFGLRLPMLLVRRVRRKPPFQAVKERAGSSPGPS